MNINVSAMQMRNFFPINGFALKLFSQNKKVYILWNDIWEVEHQIL